MTATAPFGLSCCRAVLFNFVNECVEPNQESAVRIVAVGTRDGSCIHSMMGGLGGIRLNIRVAGIAKLRLGCAQEWPLDQRMMDGMAVNAADIIFEV